MNIKLLLLPIIMLTTSLMAHASNELLLTLVSANILESSGNKGTLPSVLKFPAGDGDIKVFLRCEAYISKKGYFVNPFCYDLKDQYPKYSKEIFRAMTHSMVTPASIDGKNRKVWMPFSVLFKRLEGVEKITVVPNHLHDVKRYGYFYIAPQRYVKRKRSRCLVKLRKPLLFVQKISISGDVSDIKHQKGRCANQVAETFYQSKYIPAQLDEKYVEGTVSEYIIPRLRIDVDL